MRKDLKIAMEEAKKNNSPLPITKIIDEYYGEVQNIGGKRWDTSSLIKKDLENRQCLSPVNYYENPKELRKKIWDLLFDAVKNDPPEFRTPVFICGNEKDLDGRVVVLRKVDDHNNFIQYHSDIRSTKINKIKANRVLYIILR